MALMNYSLPFGAPIGPTGPNWSSLASGFQPAVQHANAVNGLIYDPAAHQQVHPPLAPDYYPNNPYAPPPPLRQPQFTTNNNYLPPHPPTQSHHNRQPTTTTKHTGYPHSTQPHPQFPSTRTFGESSYSRQAQNDANKQQQKGTQYFNSENPFTNNQNSNNNNNKNSRGNPNQRRPASDTNVNTSNTRQTTNTSNNKNNSNQNTKQTIGTNTNKNSASAGPIPERPGGYVKVQAGVGQKTQSVAVLDYDDDESDEYYYDDENGKCLFFLP